MNGKEFLKYLEIYIAEHGGTQKSAAKALGISAAYLNDILHGKREPGYKICNALGLHKVISFVPGSREQTEWQYS